MIIRGDWELTAFKTFLIRQVYKGPVKMAWVCVCVCVSTIYFLHFLWTRVVTGSQLSFPGCGWLYRPKVTFSTSSRPSTATAVTPQSWFIAPPHTAPPNNARFIIVSIRCLRISNVYFCFQISFCDIKHISCWKRHTEQSLGCRFEAPHDRAANSAFESRIHVTNKLANVSLN